MEIKRINTEKFTIDDVAFDVFGQSFDKLPKDLKRIAGDVYLGNITNMLDADDDNYIVDTPTRRNGVFVSKWLFNDDDKYVPYEDEDECDGDCFNCPHYEGEKAEADEEDTMCYDLDEEFKIAVAPVIKWLNENAPSHLAVITANHAVLSEVTNVTAG